MLNGDISEQCLEDDIILSLFSIINLISQKYLRTFTACFLKKRQMIYFSSTYFNLQLMYLSNVVIPKNFYSVIFSKICWRNFEL